MTNATPNDGNNAAEPAGSAAGEDMAAQMAQMQRMLAEQAAAMAAQQAALEKERQERARQQEELEREREEKQRLMDGSSRVTSSLGLGLDDDLNSERSGLSEVEVLKRQLAARERELRNKDEQLKERDERLSLLDQG